MNQLSKLRVLRGATKKNKRIGRGPGSGHGKTSTRGHKGKKARTHGVVQRGFEGGQMPLHRRLPKFGFTNIFRTEYAAINVGDLNRFDKAVSVEILVEAGMAKPRLPVKLLATGKLTKSLEITVHAASEAARKAVESAGGKLHIIKAKTTPYNRRATQETK